MHAVRPEREFPDVFGGLEGNVDGEQALLASLQWSTGMWPDH
jgi:hypothetical protein